MKTNQTNQIWNTGPKNQIPTHTKTNISVANCYQGNTRGSTLSFVRQQLRQFVGWPPPSHFPLSRKPLPWQRVLLYTVMWSHSHVMWTWSRLHNQIQAQRISLITSAVLANWISGAGKRNRRWAAQRLVNKTAIAWSTDQLTVGSLWSVEVKTAPPVTKILWRSEC